MSVARNNYKTAKRVYDHLGEHAAIAISLDLGNMTMFHMSFVNLEFAIPETMDYADGSQHGIQINIDRHGSYALPRSSTVEEETYIAEKWNISEPDADALVPFINTVLSGKDCYKKVKEEK